MREPAEHGFAPGERIAHHEFGQGVVVEPGRDGYLRAFFGVGERRVPLASVRRQRSRTERVLLNVASTEERARKAWLSFEAHVLPVTEGASALTSAKIDLLPHQVVLTHRVATGRWPHRRLNRNRSSSCLRASSSLPCRENSGTRVRPTAAAATQPSS